MKNSDIFHISAQNIDCGYSLEPPHRGDSNEYPQPVFWAEIRKNNVYPCKPQFFYIKVGFKGVKIIQACFRDAEILRDIHISTYQICRIQEKIEQLRFTNEYVFCSIGTQGEVS